MEARNEFDVLLRRALLDGVRRDYKDILTVAPPVPAFSMGYLQWRETLLKAPFRQAHPQWRRILRTAACLLLALGLSGLLLWTNPTTRAWLEKYIFQHTEETDQYEFRGQDGDPALPGTMVPAYLPEGFEEVERDVGIFASFTYENSGGERIYYTHMLLRQGGAIGLDNEHSTRSSITVNGMTGYLYTGITESDPNTVLLFDEENGFVYNFFSIVDKNELLKMAESLANTGEN